MRDWCKEASFTTHTANQRGKLNLRERWESYDRQTSLALRHIFPNRKDRMPFRMNDRGIRRKEEACKALQRTESRSKEEFENESSSAAGQGGSCVEKVTPEGQGPDADE